jgi:hypothetical protein
VYTGFRKNTELVFGLKFDVEVSEQAKTKESPRRGPPIVLLIKVQGVSFKPSVEPSLGASLIKRGGSYRAYP